MSNDHFRRNPRMERAASSSDPVRLADLSPQDREELRRELLQSVLDEETRPPLDIDQVKAMSEDDGLKAMGQVIQIDEARIRDHLGEMVSGTVEETLNALLDAEADSFAVQGVTNAARAGRISLETSISISG